jgi:PAS domain S-box-containing protein
MVVVQASANATTFLGLHESILGRSLSELGGDLHERVRPHLRDALESIPVAVRCRIGNPAMEVDALLHRPNGGGLLVELECAAPAVDFAAAIESALQAIMAASSLRALCDESARIFKEITGYDRVMVYRFDEDGHGEVFSERRQPELEPYLGNRYPASDIPQIARRLYERNRVRVIADVNYAPVPLSPRLSPISGQDLDMSLCVLRSMSPIHVQYLKNMGVVGTLVISLVVGGRLWGLISCHHYVSRLVHFEVRAACELLAEIVATRIAALESFAQGQAQLSVRRLEQRMVEAISRHGDWRSALFENPQTLLQPLEASGAALLFEDQVLTAGDVPGTQELRAIGKWLEGKSPESVFSTISLGLDEPDFAALKPVASGVLAAPVSDTPGEYLIWFRPERIRTVTWGGDPYKAVVVGNDPMDLSPRRSFAQWHQLVEGTSEKWSPADIASARLIGSSIADIVFQFRAMRMLIVEDQLGQISRQLRQSGQPVVVADPSGRILLTNDEFRRLLGAEPPQLMRVEDLTMFVAEPIEVQRRLRELLRGGRPWRGEVRLRLGSLGTRPLFVRADPVFASAERILGFVILLTDLTEQKAAETAREQFQNRIIERRRTKNARLDPKSDLIFQGLLSSVIENAQLAALEITEAMDNARTQEMLDSLRVSATRTAEVLERLIFHTGRARLTRNPED